MEPDLHFNVINRKSNTYQYNKILKQQLSIIPDFGLPSDAYVYLYKDVYNIP